MNKRVIRTHSCYLCSHPPSNSPPQCSVNMLNFPLAPRVLSPAGRRSSLARVAGSVSLVTGLWQLLSAFLMSILRPIKGMARSTLAKFQALVVPIIVYPDCGLANGFLSRWSTNSVFKKKAAPINLSGGSGTSNNILNTWISTDTFICGCFSKSGLSKVSKESFRFLKDNLHPCYL